MSLLRHIRAGLIFIRYQAWVDAPEWQAEHAKALGQYFNSPSGARFKATLVNLILRQQANALSKTGDLAYEAGYCNGQKGIIAHIEALADMTQFTETGEEDADPTTS